ncbi:MAG TPA: hypothetical protein VE085_16290 [Burkholderiales bacterium]|nr:hypothetical protein [Burkholderiales bacterium]
MSRDFIILAAISALAGCYNPRYSDEMSSAPGAAPPAQGSVVSEAARARARRDSAAGSGSSVGSEE